MPVAQRRAQAAREMAKLAKKTGKTSSPVVVNGRAIASTFWGKAWCDNLESYSDYENRLPRGRTYVRNGSVVDLVITEGKIAARVSGSDLYRIEIKIKPLAPKLWKSIQTECAGKVDSLLELLQGKLSSAVMQTVTRREQGLFPTPKEIDLDCSCPDWADMCKHVAAAMYGVGARLDQQPELLFVLRGLNPADLISKASAAEAVRQTTAAPGAAPALSESEVADVFGIELSPREPMAASAPTPAPAIPAAPKAPKAPKPRAKRGTVAKRRLGANTRAQVLAAVRARWLKAKGAKPQRKPRREAGG